MEKEVRIEDVFGYRLVEHMSVSDFLEQFKIYKMDKVLREKESEVEKAFFGEDWKLFFCRSEGDKRSSFDTKPDFSSFEKFKEESGKKSYMTYNFSFEEESEVFVKSVCSKGINMQMIEIGVYSHVKKLCREHGCELILGAALFSEIPVFSFYIGTDYDMDTEEGKIMIDEIVDYCNSSIEEEEMDVEKAVQSVEEIDG